MQAAKFANLLNARAQIKMVGIAQQNLDTELFQNVLRNTLYRRQRSHRHEDRSFDHTVGRGDLAHARRTACCLNLELHRHCCDCIEPRWGAACPELVEGCRHRPAERISAPLTCVAEKFRYIFSSMISAGAISAEILPASIRKRPKLTGSRNRLGPALPGLK